MEYSRHVVAYLVGLRESGFVLRQVIRSLADTDDGVPAEEATQLEPDFYLWQVAGHLVVYQRSVDRRRLRILVIEPAE
jgi:hypothetical protein